MRQRLSLLTPFKLVNDCDFLPHESNMQIKYFNSSPKIQGYLVIITICNKKFGNFAQIWSLSLEI